MKVPGNVFRQKMEVGKTTYGIWNNFPDPLVGELLAGAGFDWVLIDAEHGPFDLRAIIGQLQAIAPYEVGAVVRPPSGDPVFIKRMLDAGVQTLLVPMVNSPEEATALVQAMRYPPAGNRGIGAALGRASRWNQVEGYLENAERELCLIVQVESKIAYEQLDGILAVEGVDGVFFGPADLSASIGLPDQMEHPEIIDMVEKGLKRTRAAGKIAGTIALTEAGVKRYEKCGANMIGVGADALLFADAARRLILNFKR